MRDPSPNKNLHWANWGIDRNRSEQNEHQSNIYLLGVSAGFSGSELRKARSNFTQLHSAGFWVLGWKPVTWRWSSISWSWFVLSWEEGGFDFGKDWMGILGFPYIDRVSSEGSESNAAVRFKRKRNKVRVFGNRVRWENWRRPSYRNENFGFRALWCYLISNFCSLPLELLVFIILHFDLQLFFIFF